MTICFVVSGMDAAEKICYLELKGDFCVGRNRAALNASCIKDCKNHGYTSGGMRSDVTNICICQKPCAAEKTTDAGNPARARDEAANAGDIYDEPHDGRERSSD
jgi:hypothetical protein